MSEQAILRMAQGSSGPSVNRLAIFLIAAGYDIENTIKSDGEFTPNGMIAWAVKRLQAAHNLPQTGDVDEATAAAISEQYADLLARVPPASKWLGEDNLVAP